MSLSPRRPQPHRHLCSPPPVSEFRLALSSSVLGVVDHLLALRKNKEIRKEKEEAGQFKIVGSQSNTTYMHARMQTYIHIYIHIYTHTYMHIIHIQIYTCIHTCIHTYTNIYMHTCMHTCIHTYIHTYIHTCTHTYIHIHACM